MAARMLQQGENLEKMLENLDAVKKIPKSKPGLHLHLGCGPIVLSGFLNIDKYYEDKHVLQYDMFDLPFMSNSVSTIYSSHALEHLPIRKANKSLMSWHDLLEKGGRLFLAVPDLEEIMRTMLDEAVPENMKWEWYVYTLFGYQIKPGEKNPESPVDLGQFHTTGYTKKRLTHILQDVCGFSIIEMFSYDGWGTPSIWTEAVKN